MVSIDRFSRSIEPVHAHLPAFAERVNATSLKDCRSAGGRRPRGYNCPGWDLPPAFAL